MSLMYRVRVVTTGWGGAPGLNTFYFQGRTDPMSADTAGAQDCVDDVHVAMSGVVGIYPPFTTVHIEPAVDVLTAATGELSASYTTTPAADWVGTGTASYLPTAAMLCVGMTTDDFVSGHRVRGRVFLGPLTTGSDTNGTPSSATIADVENLGVDLIAAAQSYVIWHRPVSGAGGSAHVVTGHHVRDTYAVLRSRRD